MKRLSRHYVPRNDVGGRSYCDYCGRQLRWYENIPVISWLWQKGKTRCCGKKLPLQYPLVELGTGLFFLALCLQFVTFYSKTPLLMVMQIVFGLVVATLLVFSTIFDLKYMLLPDFSTFILVGLALIGVLFDEQNILPYLGAAALGSGFLLLLHLATKGKGMGMGDVKYALFMGLILGAAKTIVAFYIAFVVGAIVGIILIMTSKLTKKSAIPFGPFLILGTVVSWWWGEEIMSLAAKYF